MKDLRYLQIDDEFQSELENFLKKHFIKEMRQLIKKRDNAIDLSTSFPKTEDFNNVWKDLKKVFHEKQNKCCAICEKEITDIYSQDIEHYRPKILYWWLAYNPLNYYFSCAECNRSYKKAQFPLFNNQIHTTYLLRQTISSEVPLLLNPMYDNVNNYFKIVFMIHSNTNKGIAILEPFHPLGTLENQKASKTIEVFNLNLKVYDKRADESRFDLLHKYFNDLIDIAKARLEMKNKDVFHQFLKKKLSKKKELIELNILKLIINKQVKISPLVR